MSTLVSLPPFQLDARVADCALTAMRFQLGGRVSELDEGAAGLERDLVAAATRRANLRSELRELEGTRQELLEHHRLAPEKHLLACFARSEQVQTRLALAEQEVEALRERTDGVRMQVLSLRELSGRLGELDELRGARLDDVGARYERATRQMLQLVDDDHAATVEEVLAGPVERLADAALAVEVAGRRVSEDRSNAAEEVAHCRSATRIALHDMHRVLFRLRPEGHADEGLVSTLRQLVEVSEVAVTVRFQLLGEERRLDGRLELAAFRIVEEALDNAVEHAGGAAVDVIVSYSPERLTLLIRDGGEGFDVSATEARLGRMRVMGMITMRERAELENGTLEIRSILGVGTEVRAVFPLGGD